MTTPLFTVALPTRNRVALLREAVASALRQGTDVEVIIGDNASTDGTSAYLDALDDVRVRVLRHGRDLGMVGNWNACLAAARGTYFMLLSDDDALEPSALARLREVLEEGRGGAFSYGRATVIDSDGQVVTLGHLGPVRESRSAFVAAWFESKRTIYPCATLFRTEELRMAGGYDPQFGTFADVGAWLAVWAGSGDRPVAFVESSVARYRSHVASLSALSALDEQLAALTRLRERFAPLCGPTARSGFARIRAHFLASALRHHARASRRPLLAYCRLLVRHWRAVVGAERKGPFARQLLILGAPRAYERMKHSK